MTTRAQVRKNATALPDVIETTSPSPAGDRRPVFSVDGTVFAVITAGETGDIVQFTLPDELLPQVLADLPDGEAVALDGPGTGFAIPLASVNGQSTNYLARQAWLHAAPKALADSVRQNAAVRPGEVGDLPKSIGRPATRALSGAGITSLAKVSEHRADELLALHGVGPRAVRILAEALAEQGLELR